ncbi:MAG: 2-amino-4-hydroxy-6-hydroxymethyldihydropteridine diphosphokinase [Thermoguttaceae bacterium]
MPRCLIGLGCNLGNCKNTFEQTLAELRSHPRVEVVAVSSYHKTAPVGGPADQPECLNAVCLLESSLSPEGAWELLQQIESKYGRRRELGWGPRTLDLDLLLYEDVVLSAPNLELPHPRMAWRRFVLAPAVEVASEMIHPLTGWTIARLLEHLDTAMPYVAIVGPIAVGKTQLSRFVCEKTSARLLSETIDERSLESFYANPSKQGALLEEDFLQQRKSLLLRTSPYWSESSQLTISDFSFDQTCAFAWAWLLRSQWSDFRQQWQEARKLVVQPKLTVLLDAPTQTLMDRIRSRARPGEDYLTLLQLERIRQAIIHQYSQPNSGPVLKITSIDMNFIVRQVLAAIQAMSQ